MSKILNSHIKNGMQRRHFPFTCASIVVVASVGSVYECRIRYRYLVTFDWGFPLQQTTGSVVNRRPAIMNSILSSSPY